jgi:hypothetical protein
MKFLVNYTKGHQKASDPPDSCGLCVEVFTDFRIQTDSNASNELNLAIESLEAMLSFWKVPSSWLSFEIASLKDFRRFLSR